MASNRASAISADGRIAVGFASNGPIDRSPAVWNADAGGFYLDQTNVTAPGEAKMVSADGTVVAGDWARDTGGVEGFVWTQDGGVVRFHSDTPDTDTIYANAMTADGRYVFGKLSHSMDNGGLLEVVWEGAIVWSQDGGVRKLQDLALASGLTFDAGVTLDNVLAVSADGTVIAGDVAIAADPNNPASFPSTKPFVMWLPAAALK
jgi:uncharacterized membrane protein